MALEHSLSISKDNQPDITIMNTEQYWQIWANIPISQTQNRFQLQETISMIMNGFEGICYNIHINNLRNSNVMENSSDLNKVFSNPSYSKNSKSQASSLADMSDPKKRYTAVIQQEKHQERAQLHRQLERQKQEEEKVYKKHLKAEINKRKKELEQLQREKCSGQEQHKKAAYQAQLKKERDNIKRMEEKMRNKTADKKSKARYQAAKQRQKDIDKQINKKRIEANNLRKTHMRTEEVERKQAAKFSQSLLERQSKIEETKINNQKTAVEDYRKGLSLHGFSQKLINSSKPVTLVYNQNEEDGEAMTKAQKQQLRNSQKAKLRQQAELRNRKNAEERGNQVLSKMQRQKEYEKYCKEAEQQQRRYNLRRLEAGKKNQYAGVKPMTLSQIDINKKLKSQKEFQEMFIQASASIKNEPAGKYKITENKMVDVVVKPKKTEKWVKKPINYADNESLIPAVSEGHYSFQQQHSQDEANHVEYEQKGSSKKEIKVKPIMKESRNQQAVAVDQTGKTRLKETRLSNEALRHELNYSDSEEDSNI